MLNLKYTKAKPKPYLTLKFSKNCSRNYDSAQLLYTQHRTVLIIFYVILNTIIIVQMLSFGG